MLPKIRRIQFQCFMSVVKKITTKDVLVNAFPILGPTNKVLNKKVLLWTLLMTHLVNCQKNEIC
jgi:hypothetical protein